MRSCARWHPARLSRVTLPRGHCVALDGRRHVLHARPIHSSRAESCAADSRITPSSCVASGTDYPPDAWTADTPGAIPTQQLHAVGTLGAEHETPRNDLHLLLHVRSKAPSAPRRKSTGLSPPALHVARRRDHEDTFRALSTAVSARGSTARARARWQYRGDLDRRDVVRAGGRPFCHEEDAKPSAGVSSTMAGTNSGGTSRAMAAIRHAPERASQTAVAD
jgi:hypothetical protein